MIMEIRDRVVEMRRVRARELVPNPKNWRRHPKVQADALRGLLDEIGIADALLVRELPDRRLQLIDGHLRAETMPDEEVPVLVLDLDEAEAEKLLLSLDPLASMAVTDSERLQALMDSVRAEDPAVQVLFDHLRAQERRLLERLSSRMALLCPRAAFRSTLQSTLGPTAADSGRHPIPETPARLHARPS
jgi:ParB-like nuclease family protein